MIYLTRHGVAQDAIYRLIDGDIHKHDCEPVE